MWLSSSSVGRKMVMAITGAALVLFVTFHCLLNAIAICWPATYNSVCEFLGANWYALLASVVLAALIVIHIIYAVVLTVKNRKARGSKRYAISKRPKHVEWSSNNMLVLGIVILAFLVVHLIQFWARMQMAEIGGYETVIPPAAGTLFLQEAFGLPWTAIVYIIGFIALWFHFQHGIWSMFQSVGWDSTVWLARLKKVACWWATIVCLCFTAQAIVFTVKAHQNFFKTNAELRQQYFDMVGETFERDFGPDPTEIPVNPYQGITLDLAKPGFEKDAATIKDLANQTRDLNVDGGLSPEEEQQLAMYPAEQREQAVQQIELRNRWIKAIRKLEALIDYLEDVPGQQAPQAQATPDASQQPQTK